MEWIPSEIKSVEELFEKLFLLKIENKQLKEDVETLTWEVSSLKNQLFFGERDKSEYDPYENLDD